MADRPFHAMALNLQSHPLLSQNARVNGMVLGSDETSHLPTAEKRLSRGTMDTLIEGAYRQLFSILLRPIAIPASSPNCAVVKSVSKNL